jgi:putative DNA primase/helicase
LRRPNNLSGILNWLIEGYRLLRAEGLKPSARIKAAIAEYAVLSDVIGLFLSETVLPAERERLSTAALYNIYTAWSKSRGNRPIRVQAFVGELRNRYEIFHDRKIGNVIIGASLKK